MQKRHVMMAAVMLATVTGGRAAAQAPGSDLVVKAMQDAAGAKFLPAFCSVTKDNDTRARYAQGQLKTALEDKDAGKRAKALDEAYRTATEATEKNPKSSGAWYYLGRTALLKGEIAVAARALDEAVKVAPDCETDIDGMRQTAWAPVTNAAIDALNEQKNDVALGLFRSANLLFSKRPEALSRTGVAFFNVEQLDSAATYFSRALTASGTDTTLAAERAQVRLYLGQTLARQDKHADAVKVLEEQKTETPEDVRVLRALATSYRALGRNDEAGKLEEQSRQLGLSKSAEDGGISAGDLFNDGVNEFNAKQYGKAAELFDKVLQLEPYNRDALFNKANAQLAGGDTKALVATARVMVEREPLSELFHTYLIQSLRDAGDQDALMKAAEVFLPLAVNVEVKSVKRGDKGGTVTGTITGRDGKQLDGKPVAPAPMTVEFQWVDETGAVVGTTTVPVAALAKGESVPFTAEANVAFAGFKYVRK